MTVLTYKCTKEADPYWHFLDGFPRGIAYETSTHFVHLYGRGEGVYTISSGLTVTERKSGTIDAWIASRFGAMDITPAHHSAGDVTEGVWRPGLYYNDDIIDSMGATIPQVRQAERSLVALFSRLNEILNFVEPSPHGLLSAGHRIRELLISACTDVEDHWVRLLGKAGVAKARPTTSDYVRLLQPLHLAEFTVRMPGYAAIQPVSPFAQWSANRPTKSLRWYDAYNRTKHDKTNHLVDATLGTCIEAVAANIALFSAQYGPHFLFEGNGTIGAAFNELFTVELSNPAPQTFYVPLIDTSDLSTGIQVFESKTRSSPRTRRPLTV